MLPATPLDNGVTALTEIASRAAGVYARRTMNAPHSTPRIALVTGAGSGIGKACALALLAAGWTVIFNGRRADSLEAAIAGSPHAARAWAAPGDVSDEEAVAAVFEQIRQRHGRLDLLFNNAGVFTAGLPIDELPSRSGGAPWTSTSQAPSSAPAKPSA